MATISGVIFDFDGTLFDSMHIWQNISEEFLVEMGKIAPEDSFEKIQSFSLEESARFFIDEYGIKLSPQEIEDHINEMIEFRYAHVVEPKPGALELVEELHQAGIPIAVATATDIHHIQAALDRYGVLSYFSELVTVRIAGKGKLHPDVYNLAAKRIGATPDSAWVFEDAVHAVHTALDAGYKVAGVFDKSFENAWKEIQNVSDIAYKSLEGARLSDLEKRMP